MAYLEYDRGFTGLEAAIVLIAFVVIMAFFIKVVLSCFGNKKAMNCTLNQIEDYTTKLNFFAIFNNFDNLILMS